MTMARLWRLMRLRSFPGAQTDGGIRGGSLGFSMPIAMSWGRINSSCFRGILRQGSMILSC